MKLNNKGGISYLELFILLVILLELLIIIGNCFGWFEGHIASGNDAFTLNTCESVAKVNSLNGFDCPVNECAKGSLCTHKVGNYYVGYYDNVKNTIVGEKVIGYNSVENPSINGKKYSGNVGTMIIKVTCYNGEITYDWVLGK